MPEKNPRRAILLLLAALFLFSCLDATAKHLTHTYTVPLLVWARYTLHCLLMVVFLAPSLRWKLVATKRPIKQVVRALMLVGTTGFAMAAFRFMPLAETTSIVFLSPLAVAVLAGPFLGERVGPSRWLAVLAGFAGTLLIAQPGGTLPAAGVALALAAAACNTAYQLMTRELSPSESTVTMLFYTGLVGAVVMTMALPWYWQGPRPDGGDALLIATLGLYGGFGHYLLTRAFRLAPISTLSPILYGQLVWATLMGWAVFGDLPGAAAALGMLIIAGGGLAILFADARIGRSA